MFEINNCDFFFRSFPRADISICKTFHRYIKSLSHIEEYLENEDFINVNNTIQIKGRISRFVFFIYEYLMYFDNIPFKTIG